VTHWERCSSRLDALFGSSYVHHACSIFSPCVTGFRMVLSRCLLLLWFFDDVLQAGRLHGLLHGPCPGLYGTL
jgi:hypothetical protein